MIGKQPDLNVKCDITAKYGSALKRAELFIDFYIGIWYNAEKGKCFQY